MPSLRLDGPNQAFWRRLLSSLVLAPPVLAAVVLGMPWSLLLLLAMLLLLVWEWTKLTLGGFPPLAGSLLALGPILAVVLAGTGHWSLAPLPLLLGGAVAAAAAPALPGRPRRGLWLLAGSFYVGLPCLALLWLREELPGGLGWTLWLILVVWAADSCAYLVGKGIGGPKLWPRLSPNKTWAGFAGGTLGALAVGLLGHLWLETVPPALLAGAALLLALVAQLGDLAESGLKRRFGVKDSSGLIPGHGGLLDRVDGLLPASIALAVALWLGS